MSQQTGPTNTNQTNAAANHPSVWVLQPMNPSTPVTTSQTGRKRIGTGGTTTRNLCESEQW